MQRKTNPAFEEQISGEAQTASRSSMFEGQISGKAQATLRGSLFEEQISGKAQATSRSSLLEEPISGKAQTTSRRKITRSGIAQYEQLSSQIEQMERSIKQHFHVQDQMLHNLTCLVTRTPTDLHEQKLIVPEVHQQLQKTAAASVNDKRLSEILALEEREEKRQRPRNSLLSTGPVLEKVFGSRVSSRNVKRHEGSVRSSTSSVGAKQNADEQIMNAMTYRGQIKKQESQQSTSQRMCGQLRAVVSSAAFSVGITCLVVANIGLIAIEVDFSWKWGQEDVPEVFAVLDTLFAFTFLAEICIVMAANGFQDYFCGPDKYWNYFDMCLTATPFVELLLRLTLNLKEGGNEDALKLLRMLRLTRIARGVKVVGYVSALRDLLLAIVSTLKSLVWASILLLSIFLFYALSLTQLVQDHCRSEAISLTKDLNAVPECSDQRLTTYWSSLPESVLTLFESITGGLSWRDSLEPLRDISWLASTLMIAFVVMTDLAVLNVFIGVFCNAAIDGAAKSREAILEAYQQDKSHLVETVGKVFDEIDRDDSESVTLDEFELGLKDPRMQSFLASLNISTDDAWRLFSLLDKDQSGHLDVNEFIEGCLRYRGPATAVHFASMRVDMRRQEVTARGMKRQLQALTQHIRDLRAPPPPLAVF